MKTLHFYAVSCKAEIFFEMLLLMYSNRNPNVSIVFDSNVARGVEGAAGCSPS